MRSRSLYAMLFCLAAASAGAIELGRISVPTLVIGARYDSMDPKHMEWLAKAVQHGRYLYCPDGSHLALYDDQQVYFAGLVRFIADVDAGRAGGAAH